MTMITKVFTKKGQSESTKDAYTDLVNLNPTDMYKKQKAAGSLGGSSTSKFLSKQGKGGFQLIMDDYYSYEELNYYYDELDLYGYSEEEEAEIWDGFDD